MLQASTASFHNASLHCKMARTLRRHYAHVASFVTHVPAFDTDWAFLACSDRVDVAALDAGDDRGVLRGSARREFFLRRADASAAFFVAALSAPRACRTGQTSFSDAALRGKNRRHYRRRQRFGTRHGRLFRPRRRVRLRHRTPQRETRRNGRLDRGRRRGSVRAPRRRPRCAARVEAAMREVAARVGAHRRAGQQCGRQLRLPVGRPLAQRLQERRRHRVVRDVSLHALRVRGVAREPKARSSISSQPTPGAASRARFTRPAQRPAYLR